MHDVQASGVLAGHDDVVLAHLSHCRRGVGAALLARLLAAAGVELAGRDALLVERPGDVLGERVRHDDFTVTTTSPSPRT